MKTNLLFLAGGRVSSLTPITGTILLSLISGIAVGEFNAKDPLAKDSGNWSRSSPNTTSMVFQNSRLEVLIKSPGQKAPGPRPFISAATMPTNRHLISPSPDSA